VSARPQTTAITNPDRSAISADVLKAVADLAEARGVEPLRRSIEPLPGEKDGVLVAVLLGVAGNAAYDLLMMAIARMRARPDFDEEARIEVDGETHSLREVEQRHNDLR
jgi:hypothetical protein